MKLAGRAAFVTGASRNIGRAIALAFAAEGADLVLNTRGNREELEAVADECRKHGVRVVSVLGDIGDPDAVENMVKGGLAVLGGIDVLVCNAAIRPHTPVTETSLEQWHRVLAVNLLGVGPQGLGGDSTAFAVHVETAATHITMNPVAVNMQCHSARRARATFTEKGVEYGF